MCASTKSIVFGLLLAGTALAQGKLAVVASGDCRDPDLVANTRLLGQELDRRIKDGLVGEDEVRARLAPQSTLGIDELRRQLEAARMQYLQGRGDRAEEQVRNVLDQLSMLPVSKERWHLAAQAKLLQGLSLIDLEYEPLGKEAFRWVLRRQPGFSLADKELVSDLFSPNRRALFERLRKEVTGARKVKLEVKSQPAGADVYLDGLAVGKTPLQLGVLPDRYQVLLLREGATSLPHLVEVKSPASLNVDMQLEGAIQLERAPCLAGRGDEKDGLANAFKLGTVLRVNGVVMLRLERQPVGPSWLTAAVLDVGSGQKLREGGLKVQNPSRAPEGLGELADFIVTGQVSRNVVDKLELDRPAPAPQEPSPTAPSAGASAPAAAFGPASAAPLGPAAPSAPELLPPLAVGATSPPAGYVSATPRTWMTPAGIGLGAAGLLAGAAGAFFQIRTNERWEELKGHYRDGAPSREELPAIMEIRAQAESQQLLATTGLFAGGAALVSGAILFLLDPGQAPASPARIPVSLAAAPGSLGMAVHFR